MKAMHHPFYLNVREDFPILKQLNRGKRLVYLDNAVTAQKPNQVIDAVQHFYQTSYANIHRGIYELSEQSSMLYEDTREQVRQFINAASKEEIIFVKGTTEGINLVAHSFGRLNWQAGDEVILTEMEHHSNIVPWYLLKKQIGIELKIIPVKDNGELDLITYSQLISSKTKLVSLTHASNVLGTINPVKKIIEIAHQYNVPVLLDGAQAISHFPVDVQEIDCDFYVFSSHKLYGPSGLGILYAKKKYLDQMEPYQGGGDMIESVSFEEITFAKGPQKFEAGTPSIEANIGFQAALAYLTTIGMPTIYRHEQALINYTLDQLNTLPKLNLIGNATERVGVFSFTLLNIHPHDIAAVLDSEGIAVRAGHHCAMPLMKRFKVPATVRASLGIFNNEEDIEALIKAILLTQKVFS